MGSCERCCSLLHAVYFGGRHESRGIFRAPHHCTHSNTRTLHIPHVAHKTHIRRQTTHRRDDDDACVLCAMWLMMLLRFCCLSMISSSLNTHTRSHTKHHSHSSSSVQSCRRASDVDVGVVVNSALGLGHTLTHYIALCERTHAALVLVHKTAAAVASNNTHVLTARPHRCMCV